MPDPLRLAAKLGLILCVDQTPRQRGKKPPQYLVDDDTPRKQLLDLPSGHWLVHRFAQQPRLVPRGGI